MPSRRNDGPRASERNYASRGTQPRAYGNQQGRYGAPRPMAANQGFAVNPYDRRSFAAAHAARLAKRRRRRNLAICGAIAAVAIVCIAGFAIAKAGEQTSPTQAESTATSGSQAADIAQDRQVQQTVQEDPGDIVIGVNGDEDTYVLKGESYIEGGAHAAAADSGVLTQDIQVSGDVDTSTAGDYLVTYTVQDSAGHIAKAQRNVHVVETMETMKTGVPVCMYHYVYSADDPPDETNGNWILDTQLEEHMQYLTENGFYYPSFPEVQAFIKGTHSLPAKSIVLTFDDGQEGMLDLGGKLAAKYKIPITSFMICDDQEDAKRKVVEYANPYLEFESHSISMHQAGGTVGHGGRISAMTESEIVADLQGAAAIVGSSQAFAYPFGDTTEDGQQAMNDAGVLCAFTTKNDWCYIGDDTTALNRVRISSEYSFESFVYLVNEE